MGYLERLGNAVRIARDLARRREEKGRSRED